MTRTFVYSISAEESGTKITDYLRNHGYSRHILTCLKHTDDTVLVNGLGVYMNYVLQPDDRLTIVIPEETPSEHIVPVNLPFPVVYEDEDLMIINKPSDMPIHPSIHNYENTLANAAAWYFGQKGETFVYRCINRLDRDTTGLLILAKNRLSGALLSRMSAERKITGSILPSLQERFQNVVRSMHRSQEPVILPSCGRLILSMVNGQ